MKSKDERLLAAWKQREIPIILRRDGEGQKLRLRLPGRLERDFDDGRWLKNGRRIYPRWKRQGAYWEIPKAWFNDFVNRALERFGSVYIIQPYRETEKCARACREAQGHECECSCMGAGHGAGMDDSWFEVSEAFAIRTSRPMLACRLLVKTD